MELKRLGVLVPAGLAALVAGCGGGGGAKQTSVPPKPSQEEGGMMKVDTGATLSVGSPSAGTEVTDDQVPFDVSLANFKVDCRFAGTANRAGLGHYHVELDGKLINMFCRDRDTVSLQNVAPGRHELEFVPADNQHTDDLDELKKVSFTYRPSSPLRPITAEAADGKPSIKILSPAPGSTVRGSFDLKVAPSNFELSCALYAKNNVAGYGHWHANVDSSTKGMMGMATMLGMSCARTFHVSLAGISPGPHTFFAILEDNQHAPTPKAQDSVKLNVGR